MLTTLRTQLTVRRILSQHRRIRGCTARELRDRAAELAWKARTGTSLKRLLVPGFAMVREASRQLTGREHYPVQLRGGVVIFHGMIAEMQTGEGKTLTATLPAFLRALPGRGCHVLTSNDYLAARDAAHNRELYAVLGLTVGCVTADMEDDERRTAYANDITYGTAKEMGFDFLRDCLRRDQSGDAEDVSATAFQGLAATRSPRRGARSDVVSKEPPVQRGHEFALVDEADSVLIDEARTPLIIGLTIPNHASRLSLVRWSRRAANQLEQHKHFEFDPRTRSATLTENGCRAVSLLTKPLAMNGVDTESIYESVERAVTAEQAFQQGRDYVVHHNEIAIVDEGTGRLMEGRKWQKGLHQAIEAKEHLPVTAMTAIGARITVQSYFKLYKHLGGMTGTAVQASRELKRYYGVKVAVLPTHRPCRRRGLPPRVFTDLTAKYDAVAQEAREMVASGRAVLIGTPSVTASKQLSRVLFNHEIEHAVLNAERHAEEAAIIAAAGQAGRVTIATNMAGRGTDIILQETVRRAGGLHVIATEMHSSRRIDRQLIGRAARQGEPGSYRTFVSCEDELLQPFANTLGRFANRSQIEGRSELGVNLFALCCKAQSRRERQDADGRKKLVVLEREANERLRKMGLNPYLEMQGE